MDRRVKERLVGASILVVLIVLIVPELLSGPASPPTAARMPISTPEPVRNVTVDLATSKASTLEPVVEPASAASAPSASAQSPGQPAQASAEPAVLPAATPPVAAAPAPAPHSAPPALLESAGQPPTSSLNAAKPATGGRVWAVQLGSFASRDNADKLVRRLKGQGFAVYVSSSGSGSAMRHRVRIGPLADRAAAAQMVAKLKSLGQAASVVAPGS